MAHLLLVEDERLLRWALRGRLTNAGHTVDEASSLGEADDHLRRRRPDVVIMDVHLPDGSGIDFLAQNRDKLAESNVIVFTADGKIRQQFGSRGRDEGQFQSMTGIAIDGDGTIYVSDAQALAVQLFDSQGNFVRGWGKHEMGGANFSLPSGIAVDSEHRVYVTDELRHQVKVFDVSGKLLANFGGLGDGSGQLSFPTGVAVDDHDRVYVTERSTSRVQVFERTRHE